jgi:type II secretory pathway predicted ATPase ExeA
MYQAFCGLRERPFELTPNPQYLFFSARHREALSTLEYGLAAAKSLTVLLGDVGTGKTTLIRAALESERCRHVRGITISNPGLTRDEFIAMLATRCELSPVACRSKAVLLVELERVLAMRRARGEVMALIVDEAQRLDPDLLEEIRLLGNLETPTDKLLPLVLAGQPEFAEQLERPGMRQVKQRVALRCELSRFELAETAACIAHRIITAGGTPSELFTLEAVTLIHEIARGVPRTISVLCDNALMCAMAQDRKPVDHQMVLEVAKDLNFEMPPLAAVPPRAAAAVAAPRRFSLFRRDR